MNNKILLLIAFIAVLNSCKKNDFSSTPPLSTPPVELSISNDSVILNPTGYAPLSALVNYSYTTPGKTKIIVFGKHGDNSNIEHQFEDYGSLHSVPIIGLYPDYNNTVEIVLFGNNGDSIAKAIVNIQTGSLPDSMPSSITVDSANYDVMEPGINLVSSFSSRVPTRPYMLDNYGDIRWLLDYSSHPELNSLFYDCGIARLRNGNFYFANFETNKIYEVDLVGKIVNSWGLSGYNFHHEVLEMPNGNFLVCVARPSSTHTNGTPTTEDYIVEVDRQAGTIINTWDLKESLDEYRTALTTNAVDWIHVNALYYDSTDNTIIISGRTQGVVKLTFDNKVKWILSAHKGWGKNRRGEDLNQYLLTALDANGNIITDTSVQSGYKNHPDFEWCWYQHSCILIPNGDLMLFDNGTNRNFNPNQTNFYSRAVEYKIDPVNMTVQQIWEYGKERGMETYSAVISCVQFLPEKNHVLFCPGYQVANANGKGGKIVEVDYTTRKAVFQSSISTPNALGFHRAKRIGAYP